MCIARDLTKALHKLSSTKTELFFILPFYSFNTLRWYPRMLLRFTLNSLFNLGKS